MPGTEFMKQVRTYNIGYHISEPDLHNPNHVDGVMVSHHNKEANTKTTMIMDSNGFQKPVP